VELLEEIGAYAGLVAFLGLALLALLSFTQGRDLRRLREWAGSAPERDTERKEATSAAASERAEEMRKLEEARTVEREAADLREERRQRREEGLPEMTRAERLRERFGGDPGGGHRGGRLSERRYLIAAGVVALLVAGGAAFAVLGGSDEAGGGGQGGGQGGGGQQAGNASAQVRPSEIEVTVLNGTAVPGLAATYGDEVEGKGFQLGAVTNSSSGFEDSIVMFEPGNAPEARRVAGALDIPRVRPMTSEIAAVSAGAPVSVVIGEDNASSAG
jgi:LytR cell envelope-related transcriptional attenuator